ncbi:AzlC family ABC transporter permease [Haloarchaeobius sp. HRN-SO-5]|uniref:AzlC family ABC transporter permease n=1 Tax=Haloarchaeobius sp. HRN-SO-5 TaxID=3446118 RepID=UPI003EC0DA8E
MSLRPGFDEGVRTILPLVPATASVGLAAGVAAPAAGLTPVQSVAMSVAVYFPSVMLAALELLTADVPAFVVVVTSLVVGIRVVILSLSIAPYFDRFSTPWKLVLAYFLWTPVYALTVERFVDDPTGDVRGYYLGLAAPLWVTVQLSVVAGTVFSTTVPPGLQLTFIVPLAFIALVVRFLTDRSSKAAAVVGGVVAVLAGGVPLGLGIVVATVGGTVAGVIVERRGGTG